MPAKKPRRRTSTFGTSARLPSGRYRARYLGPDGIRRNGPHTFGDKASADAWLAKVRTEINGRRWHDPDAGAEAFGVYAERWLAERELRPRTRAQYDSTLTRHILPTFADMRLDSIAPATVNGWHRRLRTGPTMKAHAYSLLKTIIASAVADELLPRNPCTIRGAGSAKRASDTEPATLAELDVIVEHMPDRLRAMVLLAGWCAMRFGELAELRRDDVDIERGRVTIRRAVATVKADDEHPDGRVIGDPKSQAGRRKVAIPPHILPALVTHLAEHAEPGPDGLLFPATGGGHLGSRALYNAYYPAREAAGRPDLRFHDLLHTGLTNAGRAGATVADLMAIAGHTTPAMAMRYQHSSEERGQIIAKRLSEEATGTVTPLAAARDRRARGAS